MGRGNGQFTFKKLIAWENALIVNNDSTLAGGPLTVFNSTDLPPGNTTGGHLYMVYAH